MAGRMPPCLSSPTRDVGFDVISFQMGVAPCMGWGQVETRGETREVCKKCPIYHETQCSHRPYLPRWLEVVFTECFDPFRAATSLAGMGELEVGSYGRFDPAMPTAPPSLTRASRRLVSYMFQSHSRHVTSLTGRSEPEVGFHRCFDPVRAATTPSLPQLRRGSAGVHALHPIAIL